MGLKSNMSISVSARHSTVRIFDGQYTPLFVCNGNSQPRKELLPVSVKRLKATRPSSPVQNTVQAPATNCLVSRIVFRVEVFES